MHTPFSPLGFCRFDRLNAGLYTLSWCATRKGSRKTMPFIHLTMKLFHLINFSIIIYLHWLIVMKAMGYHWNFYSLGKMSAGEISCMHKLTSTSRCFVYTQLNVILIICLAIIIQASWIANSNVKCLRSNKSPWNHWNTTYKLHLSIKWNDGKT